MTDEELLEYQENLKKARKKLDGIMEGWEKSQGIYALRSSVRELIDVVDLMLGRDE